MTGSSFLGATIQIINIIHLYWTLAVFGTFQNPSVMQFWKSRKTYSLESYRLLGHIIFHTSLHNENINTTIKEIDRPSDTSQAGTL